MSAPQAADRYSASTVGAEYFAAFRWSRCSRRRSNRHRPATRCRVVVPARSIVHETFWFRYWRTPPAPARAARRRATATHGLAESHEHVQSPTMVVVSRHDVPATPGARCNPGPLPRRAVRSVRKTRRSTHSLGQGRHGCPAPATAGFHGPRTRPAAPMQHDPAWTGRTPAGRIAHAVTLGTGQVARGRQDCRPAPENSPCRSPASARPACLLCRPAVAAATSGARATRRPAPRPPPPGTTTYVVYMHAGPGSAIQRAMLATSPWGARPWIAATAGDRAGLAGQDRHPAPRDRACGPRPRHAGAGQHLDHAQGRLHRRIDPPRAAAAIEGEIPADRRAPPRRPASGHARWLVGSTGIPTSPCCRCCHGSAAAPCACASMRDARTDRRRLRGRRTPLRGADGSTTCWLVETEAAAGRRQLPALLDRPTRRIVVRRKTPSTANCRAKVLLSVPATTEFPATAPAGAQPTEGPARAQRMRRRVSLARSGEYSAASTCRPMTQ